MRSPEWNGADFVAAIEAEDETAAIAQVRGALAQNLSCSSIRPAIGEAALAHYADFGHCAIYTLKAGQLIASLVATSAEGCQWRAPLSKRRIIHCSGKFRLVHVHITIFTDSNVLRLSTNNP
jgi:hypothetical protein